MRAHILGCRGSTPATGAEFARYGGDTSSVAVSAGGGPPSLVLDAGTGLQRLSDVLGDAPFRGILLLTHLHWDHTHGLPFAAAVDNPDAEVDLFLPAQGGDPESLLARAMGPPHFPIRPSQLRGIWRFHALEPGTHRFDEFAVTAAEIPHKGGRTYGYRIDGDGKTLTYMPDHAPGRPASGPHGLGEIHPAARDLAEGADILVHDSQHLAAEWPERAFLGHATVEYALDLGERAGATRLVLFHHDPKRTDAELDSWNTGSAVLAEAGDVHEI